MRLPIESIRDDFLVHHARGPMVIVVTDGIGKSMVVPSWCDGRVLVVEPRRVVCRSLAQRVAQLCACPLGYHVRNEKRAGAQTQILFATPRVVLRMIDGARGYDTLVLDEFHERRLDVDLLLASMRTAPPKLVVMSATMQAECVTAHVRGTHLRAEGRRYPVRVRYLLAGRSCQKAAGWCLEWKTRCTKRVTRPAISWCSCLAKPKSLRWRHRFEPDRNSTCTSFTVV